MDRVLPRWVMAPPHVFAHLFSNPLFAICAAFLGLVVLETVVPFVLWKMYNALLMSRRRIFARAMVRAYGAGPQPSGGPEGQARGASLLGR
jgi:hypothetical protein